MKSKLLVDDLDFSLLKCDGCQSLFYVIDSYSGVITCPYCGDYIEG